MKLTPSQVKNIMRRGLRLLIDPEPEATERKEVMAFFDHCCAYCGTPIENGKGDLDHLLSSASGGRNHISNRVFSCKPCNAEQKRDKDWEEFLLEKHGNGNIFDERHQKIIAWVNCAGDVPPLQESILEVLEEQARSATEAYDRACKEIRNRL